MFKRCIGFGALVTLVSLASGADWPQWHGPDRNAFCKETGLLKNWPKEGPAVVWKAKNLGDGYSSPSVAGGKVFGGGSDGKDEVVWALEEASGKELWRTPIASATNTNRGNGTRGTPTVDGDRVYALGVSGDLVCLDAGTGKVIWQKNLKKDFAGAMMSGWGYSESPLIDGDTLVCTPGGKGSAIVALKKSNGDVIWKSSVPDDCRAAYSSIVISEAGGTRQYVTLLRRGIVGVAAKDGKFLWGYNRIANGTANIPTPVVQGNFVFCSTGYGTGSALLELKPDGPGMKAEEKYFLSGKELQNHHGGMVLVGDHLYGGHGHNAGAPVCLEMKTGKIAWKQARGPGGGSAAVLYADGNLYFRYESGVLALIEASPQGYKEISSFKLPDNSGKPSWPHPVIANGKLFIRDQGTMICFDVKQAK